MRHRHNSMLYCVSCGQRLAGNHKCPPAHVSGREGAMTREPVICEPSPAERLLAGLAVLESEDRVPKRDASRPGSMPPDAHLLPPAPRPEMAERRPVKVPWKLPDPTRKARKRRTP
jgi:hypothetical protein